MFIAGFLLGVLFTIFCFVVSVILVVEYLLRRERMQTFLESKGTHSLTPTKSVDLVNDEASLSDLGSDKKKIETIKEGWMRVIFDFNPDDTIHSESLANLQKISNKSMHILSIPISHRKEYRFVVLKNRFLFIYDGEECKECLGAVFIEDVKVEIVDGIDGPAYNGSLKPVSDSSLYAFDRPIKLYSDNGAILAQSKQCFLFAKSSVEKEDWYFAFLSISSHSKNNQLRFPLSRSQQDYLKSFSQNLDRCINGNANNFMDDKSKWFNAFLGRIFMNVHRSQSLHDHFLRKFKHNLAKTPKPSFLKDVKILRLELGTTLPLFYNGSLVKIEETGSTLFSMEVKYSGNARVILETEAEIQIPKMKSLIIPLQLELCIRRFSSKALFKIKEAPSDRLWYGFYESPSLDLDVKPIVSTRSLQLTIVTGFFEKKVRDLIQENLVLPNMDDIMVLPGFKFDMESGEELELPTKTMEMGSNNVKSSPINIDDKSGSLFGSSPSMDNDNQQNSLHKRQPKQQQQEEDKISPKSSGNASSIMATFANSIFGSTTIKGNTVPITTSSKSNVNNSHDSNPTLVANPLKDENVIMVSFKAPKDGSSTISPD